MARSRGGSVQDFVRFDRELKIVPADSDSGAAVWRVVTEAHGVLERAEKDEHIVLVDGEIAVVVGVETALELIPDVPMNADVNVDDALTVGLDHVRILDDDRRRQRADVEGHRMRRVGVCRYRLATLAGHCSGPSCGGA